MEPNQDPIPDISSIPHENLIAETVEETAIINYYDSTFQRLFKRCILRVLPIFLPQYQIVKAERRGEAIKQSSSLTVDCLWEVTHKDGTIEFLQIEVQTLNDSEMGFRMLEYYVPITKEYGMEPTQVVLYFGKAPLKMTNFYQGKRTKHEFFLADVRDYDADTLLYSGNPDMIVLSILAFHTLGPAECRQILEEITSLKLSKHDLRNYMNDIRTFTFIRGAQEIFNQTSMYYLEEVKELENAILNDGWYLKGVEKGIEKGIEKGKIDMIISIFQKGMISKSQLLEQLEWSEQQLEEYLTQSSKNDESQK